MKVRLEVSTVWNVHPDDETLARGVLKNQPVDVVTDYIIDALHGSTEFERTECKAVELL